MSEGKRKKKAVAVSGENQHDNCRSGTNDLKGTSSSSAYGNGHVPEEQSKDKQNHVGSPQSSSGSSSIFHQDHKPFSFTLEVDVAASILFVLGIATRMWRLDEPRSIVFDELHYGKYASLYMKNTFFFDSHPPLGKQLVALAGYIAGFDGNSQFDRIGGNYNPTVPLFALRFVPAFFGSLLIPTVYYLVVELGMTHQSAVLAGFLIVFENALLTQSRFILMESILLFFSTFGVLCTLKFRKYRKRSFGLGWWIWLILSAVFLTCALCVKYIGFFTALLSFYIMARDFWELIGNKAISDAKLWVHFFCRGIVMTVIPVAVYLSVFYVHLSILTKAGPHDNIMTSAFQASLEGGLASITKGQPLEVVHGSQITLRHTHGRTCWMHSHPAVYPIKYPDGRGSSHQQQVTCYSFKDVNNWWIVKRPNRKDIVVTEPLDRIKHGDIIQLVHGMTSRALNSHDVAAAMSPQHQEVSCYINYNISFPSQNLWRVEIINRETEGDVWHTIHSHIHLIHVNTSQALKFSGRQLPDWGYNQHEVVTDRVIKQDDTIWNVEEHRYTKNADEKDRERELVSAEFVPLQPTHLTFFQKLWELQYKMLTVNQENVQDHMYSSEPTEWPFLTKGIAYWVSPHSNAQIHLIGNIAIWYCATLSIVIYGGILCFYLMRRRRLIYDIPEGVWEKFCFSGEVCLCGYFLHVVPYFFADRTLFLHHYLPALMYKILVMVVVIEHLSYLFHARLKSRILLWVFYLALAAWILVVLFVFIAFSVFCFGLTSLSAQQVLSRKWKDTWDFIIHKP